MARHAPDSEERRTRGLRQGMGKYDAFGYLELPVFDRGKYASTDPATRAGLADTGGIRSNFHPHVSRRPTDARPGRPVPCGEPHPDRFAIAEAIRRQIEEKDARWKLLAEEPSPVEPARRGSRATRQGIEIDDPVRPYVEPAPGEAIVVVARRGGREMKFTSVRAAAICLTGSATTSNNKAIENAASLVNKKTHAFGWTWERVGRPKGGRPRK